MTRRGPREDERVRGNRALRFFHCAAPTRVAARLFFFQAEDGIRDYKVTGVQTCALPIFARRPPGALRALADLDRHEQWRHVRVGRGSLGDRDDVKAEVELEVIDLHRGTELDPPAR